MSVDIKGTPAVSIQGAPACNASLVVSPDRPIQTVTINDENGIPIPCACVSVTTDVDGNNPISEGKADASAVFEFEIPETLPPKIYIWRSKKGFRLKNPISIPVTTK